MKQGGVIVVWAVIGTIKLIVNCPLKYGQRAVVPKTMIVQKVKFVRMVSAMIRPTVLTQPPKSKNIVHATV
jgi:hypothetical protein